MRWNLLVAGALLACALIAVITVACSSTASCKPGTLELDVALLQTAPLADTITVIGTDPGAEVNASFPHTPNPTAPGVEHVTVDVTWPGGYPADKLVHLVVRALGGVTVLGVNGVTIHLDPGCSTAGVAVTGGIPAFDLGGVD